MIKPVQALFVLNSHLCPSTYNFAHYFEVFVRLNWRVFGISADQNNTAVLVHIIFFQRGLGPFIINFFLDKCFMLRYIKQS